MSSITLQSSAQESDEHALESMQKVIDLQRKELEAQSQQLKSQERRLEEQQRMLESMQLQLQSLVRNRQDDRIEPDPPDEDSVTLAETTGDDERPAAETRSDQVAQDDSADDTGHRAFRALFKPMNEHFLDLDRKPLDIPDDTGIFLYSKDGSKMLRLFGSLRALAVYDNRQNFHAYDLNIPQVPVGAADFKDWNQEWTINTTKVGFQMDLQDYFTVFSEFDWKGESGDALRIRHMYMRNANWLVGKHWTAFN